MRISYDRIRHPEKKVNIMDIPWGAWVNELKYDEQSNTYDVMGIYDTITRAHKSDYPFHIDLRVALACYATPAERDLSFKVTLLLTDMDAIVHLYKAEGQLEVPEGDIPKWWYEAFDLEAVEFAEPGRYFLHVLIDNQEKQSIPLWIEGNTGIAWDDENRTETKFWAEDYKKLHDDGLI